jgi:hypothetical protein
MQESAQWKEQGLNPVAPFPYKPWPKGSRKIDFEGRPGVRFVEQGREPDPQAKKQRARMLARALRKLGYQVTITPINQVAATRGIQI